MSSAYSSGTPATDRRYVTSAAPSSSARGARLTRGMKGVLLLAALAVLIIAIVPAVVVTTRKDYKNNAAQDLSAGYTTVINGVTTFVQTRTASVVTRSSYSTLPNGRVSTVLQAVTLPIVTVSVTSAGAVQTGFETVTIDGQAVVVATQTQYVAGGQVVVTRTIQNGQQAVATVYSTAFEDLTARHGFTHLHVGHVFLGLDEQRLHNDARAIHIERPVDHEPIEQLFIHRPSAFFVFDLGRHHEPAHDEPAADLNLANEQLNDRDHQRQPDFVLAHDFCFPNYDEPGYNATGLEQHHACLHSRSPSRPRWMCNSLHLFSLLPPDDRVVEYHH